MVERIHLKTPLDEKTVRSLRVGQFVLISGIIITARDRLHRYLYEKRPEMDLLKGAIIYHSGPIVKNNTIISAGPTTSMRLEHYTPEIIRHYGIRAIIGKGGMGGETEKALKKYGAVYLQAPGGASVYLAKRIKGIRGVKFLEEFGMPEALWILEVEDFPAVVTMDTEGENLHKRIERKSRAILFGSP